MKERAFGSRGHSWAAVCGLVCVAMCAVDASAGDGKSKPGSQEKTGTAVGKADVRAFKVARVAEGRVEAQWIADRWDAKQRGYRLLRREVSGTDQRSEWETVGPSICRPDLSESWLKKNKLDRVLKNRGSLKQDRLGSDQIIAEFRRSPEEMSKIVGFAAMDIQWAIAFGFAWIDRESDVEKTYEYGIARVFRDHLGISVGPVEKSVILQAGIPKLPPPSVAGFALHRTRKRGVVEVRWQLPVQELSKIKPRAIAVLRGDPAGPLVKVVSKQGIFARKGDEEGRIAMSWTDSEAGVQASKYGIAYVDAYGRVGIASEPAVARAEGAKLAAPIGLSGRVTDEGVRLTWRHVNVNGPFDGFVVSRSTGDLSPHVPVSDVLPTGRRFFLDSKVDKDMAGRDVIYYVTAISGDSRLDETSHSEKVHIPFPKPPAPEGFSVEIVVQEKKRICKCKLKDVSTSGVDYYEVRQLDPKRDQWLEIGAIKHGKGGGQFEFVPVVTGRAEFRCRAVTVDKTHGDMSEAAVGLVPLGETVADVTWFRCQSSKQRVDFSWYCAVSNMIRGFRIYSDGKLIADEDALSGLRRSWSVSGLDWQKHTYSIVVVDLLGRTSSGKNAGEIGKSPPATPR